MRSLSVTLKPTKPGRPATIHAISCLHVGHGSHDRKRTLELLNDILDTPDHYLINLGDTGDNGTKTSPGASVYEQTLNPREQAIVIAALFRPLVAARKVLWWHDSNHSMRTYKDTGFFTMEETVARLFFGADVPDELWRLLARYAAGDFAGKDRASLRQRLDLEEYVDKVCVAAKPASKPLVQWAGWQAITKLRAGKQEYLVHSMHGEGAGTAPSSALAAVVKQGACAHADLYLRGHHHKKVATDGIRPVWDASGRAAFRRVGYLTTGCMLGYHDSYAEAKGYVPNAPGMARVILETGDRWGFKFEV